VTAVVWEDGCVAGAEVEGTGIGTAEEDSCSSGAALEVEPFGGVGVPVEFT